MEVLLLTFALSLVANSASACLSKKSNNGLPISTGRCPDIKANFTLDRDRFLGGWYEQRTVRVPLLQPSGMSCGYSIYGEDGTKDSIHEWHIQTMPKGNILEICGKYDIPEGETWKLMNTHAGIPMTHEYVILDTDYETYYAGYNCRDIPLLGLKIEGGWVFTRAPNPPSRHIETAMEVYKRYGISTADFIDVEHPSDCVYRFQDSCLTRKYPKTAQQHITFIGRVLFENTKRLISTLTPNLNLFGHNNVEAREVPEDEANFHFNQIKS